MRRFFFLALFAAPFTGCDSEPDDPVYAPAPVVSEIAVRDRGGNFLSTLSAAAVDSTLATTGPAPIATELLPLGISFPTTAPTPGDEGAPSAPLRLSAYPSPFNAFFRLELSLPESERAGLYILPAVTEEGNEPPEIRAGMLAETPDGFDGVPIAEGPSVSTTLLFKLDPQALGMDYGVYRVVAFSDGARAAADMLYAPCVDDRIAGLRLCQ